MLSQSDGLIAAGRLGISENEAAYFACRETLNRVRAQVASETNPRVRMTKQD